MKDFVNLHVHTTYSIMQSLIEPKQLFKRVKELNQSAVAVTDTGSLACAHDGLKYSREAGVKLIMGGEFYFTNDFNENSRLRHVILLAKNHVGYKNLLRLGELGYENGIVTPKKVIPRIDWKLLGECSEGLICTTSCSGGILGHLINNRKLDEAKIQAKKLKDIFGDSLAFEIEANSLKRVANNYRDYEDQKFTNHQLIKLGRELDVKVIATSNAHFLYPEQYEAHDTILAIGCGQPVKSGNRPKYTNEFYLKTREEIVQFFSMYGSQAEEFCDNTLYFAALCENPDWIEPKWSNPSGLELPEFPVQDQPDYQEFKDWWATKLEYQNKKEDEAYLRYRCELSLLKLAPKDRLEEYRQRIEKELEILEMKDLCSYMLIVSDYVNWAKENNIATGPGRGSAGGSLAAHYIGIHDADSIKYGLIFERFYNKAKVGLSDIDLDFSKKGKPLVEKYVVEKYGKRYCAQVSNYATLTPKPYAKAISRSMMYGGDQKTAVLIGNSIAESIPKEFHSVESALEGAPLFAEFANSEKYHHLKTYAKDIGNKFSNLSVHAGATIIGKRPLAEIVPVRKTKDGLWAVEYEKERAEANGLAKMDLLGLSTLDIIEDTFKLIKQNNKQLPPLPWDYDKNDPLTYELIGRGDTFGVFQLGTSGGTIDLCKKMGPKNIEDLAMINALARPGFPKDVRDDFIHAKKSGKKVETIHPVLERSFAPTFGYALYDEVLMQLAQDVAGWDLNEADRLRKFVKEKGKYPEKDKKLKEDFIYGAIHNTKLSEEVANQIWDEVISGFGNYAFNKAHAVCYSFLSYQTAYLKAHYPLEFLTANLAFECQSNALDSEENILKFKNEIRNLNVKIIPPDINKSEMTYKIIDDKTLMTGLDALKFMGKDAIPEIIEKRPFSSFDDFLSRVDGRKVRVTAVQALAASGCLDSFGLTRKQMFLYASDYKKKIQLWNKANKKDSFEYPWPKDIDEWTIPQKFAMEHKYLGEGLSGNKFQIYSGFFSPSNQKFQDFYKDFPDPGDPSVRGPSAVIRGVIVNYFEFKVKKEDSKSFGMPMAKFTIEDPWGYQMGLTIFAKKWPEFKKKIKELLGSKAELQPGVAIAAKINLNWYDGNLGMAYEELLSCANPPAQPQDLKHKKVSMRISSRKKKTEDIVEQLDADDLLEEIEDQLAEEGFLDFQEDFIENEDEEEFPDFD